MSTSRKVYSDSGVPYIRDNNLEYVPPAFIEVPSDLDEVRVIGAVGLCVEFTINGTKQVQVWVPRARAK